MVTKLTHWAINSIECLPQFWHKIFQDLPGSHPLPQTLTGTTHLPTPDHATSDLHLCLLSTRLSKCDSSLRSALHPFACLISLSPLQQPVTNTLSPLVRCGMACAHPIFGYPPLLSLLSPSRIM
jgi:hypothetical protein